jgi:hypothetical protein
MYWNTTKVEEQILQAKKDINWLPNWWKPVQNGDWFSNKGDYLPTYGIGNQTHNLIKTRFGLIDYQYKAYLANYVEMRYYQSYGTYLDLSSNFVKRRLFFNFHKDAIKMNRILPLRILSVIRFYDAFIQDKIEYHFCLWEGDSLKNIKEFYKVVRYTRMGAEQVIFGLSRSE